MARGVRSTHAKLQHVSLPGKHTSFTLHKGRLHRALGVPEGEKIGQARIKSALKSKRKFEGQSVAEMARSARGLTHMKKKKK